MIVNGRAILDLTPERWSQLREVNERINRLPYRSDAERWKRPEFWVAADTSGGDCEDYAIAKRNALVALGWPRSALPLAACVTEAGEGHGVLLVETDGGVYVLDNRHREPMPWKALPYSGWIREVAGRFAWDAPGQAPVEIASPVAPVAPMTAAEAVDIEEARLARIDGLGLPVAPMKAMTATELRLAKVDAKLAERGDCLSTVTGYSRKTIAEAYTDALAKRTIGG
mgnify:CR=1 FL=1